MSDRTTGFLTLVGAYTIWGLSALYYREISHVPALEILAHRTVWSFVAFFSIIALQGRMRELWRVLSPRSAWSGLYRIAPAAFFVSVNWFLFVYAIQNNQTFEASLAYYISPIMAAVVGWVVFSERLKGLQWPAMVLALIAVAVLTVGLGHAPWLSLAMSASFIAYSGFKKGLEAGPTLAMAAETTLLVPLSLSYLIGAQIWGWGGSDTQAAGAFGSSWRDSLLLVFSGVMTGVPLVLFAMAANRVALSTLGLGHYYNASLQLIVSVMIFGQVMTSFHAVALPLVWIAVTLFSLQAFRADRQARKARKAAASSPIEEMV